ncbi:MAG: DotU family type IV/VI secretion system protein [Gammaproteobacteria bacterium]|nr:DotU family type IV/VI secretion system protein [Gammaproteobacteria bacterium]MDH5727619.1 DotU family type IV/VI secretion system protein [Gammaproteobacteria bacterium]
MAKKSDEKSLANIFSNIFAYVITMKRTCPNVQPSFAEVRGQVLEMLEQSIAIIRDQGIDPRDYDDARFAVVAWVDETLLGIPWIHKEEWQRSLLQYELYNSAQGGEEFFDRLNQLSQNQNAVREVYLICLSLGFTGRFCHDGDDLLLEQLKRSSLQMLNGDTASASAYAKRVMFRQAYKDGTAEQGMAASNDGRSAWTASKTWLIAAPPVIIAIVFLAYTFVLNSMADNVMTRVVGG